VYEKMTTGELLGELARRSDLTERELVLVDRLQEALEEIDALMGKYDAQVAKPPETVKREAVHANAPTKLARVIHLAKARAGAVVAAGLVAAGMAAASIDENRNGVPDPFEVFSRVVEHDVSGG